MNVKNLAAAAALCAIGGLAVAQNNNVIEEVAWIIGDEPIYKSEIEEAYMEMQQSRTPIVGDPYCVIPEQIAVERLFLHQAELDTVEVQEAMVQQSTEAQLNVLINNLGSKEKVEQYFGKPFAQLREYYADMMRDRFRTSQVRNSLTKNLKVTPADVRRYFNQLPEDSIPFVPMEVEVQILTINPVIPRQEIEDVKARLRDMADRVNRGEADFHTLAVLYSEAPEGMRGGELGFMGRGHLAPEFAAVAFNLNDPKKVSKIVETEYGYHIIQLIEKRGDRINCRHILLRPKVAEKDLKDAIDRLDSLRTDIVDRQRIPFEQAVRLVSQDKDTRNSHGMMVNEDTRSTHFQMSELPQDISRVVGTMEVGDISQPFIYRDGRTNREVVAIVKLTNRIPAHRANLSDDYQLIKDMYENSAKDKMVEEWLLKKIADTYVRIEDGWRGCDFHYKGWIKSK